MATEEVSGPWVQSNCLRRVIRSDQSPFASVEKSTSLSGFCGNPRNNGVLAGLQVEKLTAGNEPWSTKLQQHSFGVILFYLSEIRRDSILKLNRERNFSLFPDALLASAHRKNCSVA